MLNLSKRKGTMLSNDGYNRLIINVKANFLENIKIFFGLLDIEELGSKQKSRALAEIISLIAATLHGKHITFYY